MGKERMEAVILMELNWLLESLGSQCAMTEIMDPSDSILHAVGNIICVLVYGKRFSEEMDFQYLEKLVSNDIANFVRKSFVVQIFARYGKYLKKTQLNISSNCLFISFP